jgi:hypothetical protein
MKIKLSKIIEECVERGVIRGYRRAFKHIENPDDDVICSNIEDCVMGELYEYISFEDEINE